MSEEVTFAREVHAPRGLRVGGVWSIRFGESRDGKTLMTMIQRGLPTAELRREHLAGLPNAFARLERAIEK